MKINGRELELKRCDDKPFLVYYKGLPMTPEDALLKYKMDNKTEFVEWWRPLEWWPEE
jgi:hypothetical protein